MLIREFTATNIEPIKNFHVTELSNVVVFAGPNGVGKTRLLNAITGHIQSGATNVACVIEATSEKEATEWGKRSLNTADASDKRLLMTTLQRPRKRTEWESAILNFESNRAFERVDPYNFNWDYSDPFAENMDWSFGLHAMKDRFRDVTHSIFRKVRARRENIAKHVEEVFRAAKRAETPTTINATISETAFPDPLLPFRAAFSQLLGPKELLDADFQGQNLSYSFEGKTLPLTSLSSGEREVVNIAFDFILRSPSHSIIIFDEPELHLHPELSFKLLETLKTLGSTNQFIFCTHSADIITASLENSVVFVAPPNASSANQAIPVKESDATNQALHRLGQSVGIISLGRRIVLIEGSGKSLDKQTYGSIIAGKFPSLVLAPSGGKDVVRNFSTLVDSVISKTIWGVDFFMLCDGDAYPALADKSKVESASAGRLRVLPRYHIENYFLDEEALAGAFKNLVDSNSWLRDRGQIRQKLIEIGRALIPYSIARITSGHFRDLHGNIDLMPSGVDTMTATQLIDAMTERALAEKDRVAKIDRDAIKAQVDALHQKLHSSLDTAGDDAWKAIIPGRPLLGRFASAAKIDVGHLKTAYINNVRTERLATFSEIERIFDSFANFDAP